MIRNGESVEAHEVGLRTSGLAGARTDFLLSGIALTSAGRRSEMSWTLLDLEENNYTRGKNMTTSLMLTCKRVRLHSSFLTTPTVNFHQVLSTLQDLIFCNRKSVHRSSAILR